MSLPLTVGRALVATCLLVGAAPALAATTSSWDCFVATGSVDCSQLEAAFFDAVPLLARVDVAATLHIQVRSEPFQGGIEYVIDVDGGPGEHTSLIDRIPSSFSDSGGGGGGGGGNGNGTGGGGGFDSGGGGGRGTGGGNGRGRIARNNIVVVRVVADLERAITPFLSLEAPATADGGALTLVLGSPGEGAGQGRIDDEHQGWFVSPALSGDVSQTALLRVQGRAQLDANWSDPVLRVFGTAYAGFVYLSAPGAHVTDPAQTFGYQNGGAALTFANALWQGVSVGVTGGASTVPEQNEYLRIDGYTGLEWVLVPFLATSGGNIGARYVLGVEHQEYIHENVLKRFEGNFLRHRLVGFASWHFAHVDVAGSVAGSSVVDNLTYSDVSASASVSWRVLNDLSLSLTATGSYRNALINAPDNLNELNPLERFVGGGNFGAVNYSAAVSVVYVLGNSLLVRQDQRWSNGTE